MDSEHNKLDNLETNLYSQEYKPVPVEHRTPLTQEQNQPTNSQWNSPQDPREPSKPLSHSFLKKVLIASIAFFIIALGLAGFIFFRGLNIISSDKISVSFLGPASIGASQELAFDVVVKNSNKIPIADTKVYIDYPEGTKDATDITKDLSHVTEKFATIAQDADARRTMRAVLFGKESETKQIKVTVEYGVPNNSATYRKEALYTVRISSVPLQMNIDGPTEIISGNEVETKVTITSNSNVVMNNILLKAQYPFGYTYITATPVPTYDSTHWLFKTIKPGEKITITLRGRLEGQEKDSRAIHFSIGSQKNDDEKVIGTTYLSDLYTLNINKPALLAKLLFNEKVAETNPTVSVGSTKARVLVTNTTSNVITNLQVKVGITGSALNPGSVVASSGSYNQANSSILWNQNLQPSLYKINAGEEKYVDFSFSTLGPDQIKALQNGSITFSIVSTGETIEQTGAQPKTISANVIRTAKIQSTVTLASNATYSVGPFKNTGPVPPRVNNKTTYTITWILTNSTNPVIDGKVQAVLPPNIRWLGKVNPTNETITWNSDQNTIVWPVGTLGAHGKKQVSFQVELEPTSDQLGVAPQILNGISFVGTDSSTSQSITVESSDLTTYISTDPQYSRDYGIVQN